MMSRLLIFLCLVLMPSAAAAQEAPVFLEPGHWAWDAIRRISVAGLAPAAADPAAAPVTVRHVRSVFTHAAAAADSSGQPELASLARGYLRWLEGEADSAGAIAAIRLSAGWTKSEGEALGGEGYFPDQDWIGARPLRSSNHPSATLRAHGHVRPWLAWSIDGGYLADQWVVPAATLGTAFGSFDAWAGRRRLQFASGRGGGIVTGSGINDMPAFAHRTLDTFEGIGIGVREPFRFPWVFRALGPVRIEVAGGRISRNGLVNSPNVVFGRLTMSPFSDRLTIGVNRGAVFGGEGNGLTAGRVLGMIFGLRYAGFEDQVISGIVRYRPPLGTFPLALYLEYGADDTAGAISDVPTYIAGLDIAAVPGLPSVAVGLEHTRFSQSCCGNPRWYRNVFFRGSWSDEGRLFAHPLGGNGYEWLVHGRMDLPDSGVLLRAEGFRRWRGHENLFAPERAGLSLGGMVSLEYRSGRTGVRLDGGYEDGAAWGLHRVSAMVSRTFH